MARVLAKTGLAELSVPLRPAHVRSIATAVPGVPVRTDAVWGALQEVRGRRMPGLVSGEEAPTTRYLAEPLEAIMRTRTVSEQTNAYLEHARRLSREAGRAALDRSGLAPSDIGLLIFVSCTGFVLPSLDAELIPHLGLRRDTARLPIAELGCGGGVAALARTHDYVRAQPDRAVLVVAVELPSLTFQPQDRSVDNLVAAVVFGDGAGAAVVDSGEGGSGWSVLRTGTRLVPEGARHLGYELRDGGLHVILTRELPGIIEARLREAVEDFLSREGLGPSDLDIIAAHPGGPRIFDAMERALELPPGRLAVSRKVFGAFGNVSSAGIFFVLSAFPRPVEPALALAVAFGPGLSIELALMRFER